MTKKKKSERRQRLFIVAFLFLLIGYALLVVVRSLSNSHFVTREDRINIVFYGERTAYLSIGRADAVNYAGFFENDVQIVVPGGYDRYRVGALGKLAALEASGAIIQRALSSATSTWVNFYFSPKDAQVYNLSYDDTFFLPKLGIQDIFTKRRFDTNAGFFDRLYVYILLLDKRKSDFVTVGTGFVKSEDGALIFQEDDFNREHQGFFYQKFLREEGEFVKIRYRNSRGAQNLSRVLEGEGIRVVDLSRGDRDAKKCIITKSQGPSKTAAFLARRLDCKTRVGETADADIIIVLGAEVEEAWE